MSARPTIPQRLAWRAIAFRAAAVLLGLLPFAIIEVALRIADRSRPELGGDPFVGFSGTRPLFELNETGERFETASSRRTHFYPDSFAAKKAPHEFRIFCLGDSTVQGNPWTIETAFSTWLELSLNAADSSRKWEVVNCGGISYASYRLVPILEEIVERHQPDLIVLHASHNEFLEDRTYRPIKQTPAWLIRAYETATRLRLFNGLRSAARQLAGSTDRTLVPQPNTTLPTEVVARLDLADGLKSYRRDPDWQRDVITHFEFNLRSMIAIAHRAGVPLIVLNPACNLRDVPPFKVESRASLSDQDRDTVRELWASARRRFANEPHAALQLLRDAIAIDDQHAGLRYDLAQRLDSLAQFDAARAEYQAAKELDICPLRILTSMNDLIQQIGTETGTPVIDLRVLFDRLSRHNIRGADWFADHVHPTIPGQQQIADELGNELVRRRILRPTADWFGKKEIRYAAYLDSLPATYFAHAQQRLQALMNWTHGHGIRRDETD